MSDSRLDTLRRRVDLNPASPAFAALAEECRKAGLFEEAVERAQAGLERFPTYLSARVTLGRALMELGRLEEARDQLETVVDEAPENLAAMRALADLHRRLGDGDAAGGGGGPATTDIGGGPITSDHAGGADFDAVALESDIDHDTDPDPRIDPQAAAAGAPMTGRSEPEAELPDDDPDAALAALEKMLAAVHDAEEPPAVDPTALDAEVTASADAEIPGAGEPTAPPAPDEAPLDDDPRVVAGLERFLDAILRHRQTRRDSGG